MLWTSHIYERPLPCRSVEVYVGKQQHDMPVCGDEKELVWIDTSENFFDMMFTVNATLIRHIFHADLSGGWNVNTRLTPKSFLNVQMTSIADKFAELWELGEHVYRSKCPWSAEGANLDNAVQMEALLVRGRKLRFTPSMQNVKSML